MLDLPPPAPAIEFILSSRGVSKGLAQTDGPQLRVQGEVAFGPLYVGAYAKNVDSSTSDGEAAAFVGAETGAAGFDFDIKAAWKRAIDPAPGTDTNSLELQGSVSRDIGRLTPEVSVTWSADDVGSTGRTLFAEAGAGYRLGKALTASAAFGRRERTGGADYTAWNAGVAWAPAKPLVLDVRYYDTDGGDSFPYRARVVVSGRLKF